MYVKVPLRKMGILSITYFHILRSVSSDAEWNCYHRYASCFSLLSACLESILQLWKKKTVQSLMAEEEGWYECKKAGREDARQV